MSKVRTTGVDTAPIEVSANAAELAPDHASTAIDACTPVPLSATVCGEPAALDETEACPVRAAADPGLKASVSVHDAPAATLDPQSWLPLNPAPVTVMEDMLSGAVPLLVSVTVRATAAAPTVAVPKSCDAGASVTAGAGAATTVPFRLIVTGLVFDETTTPAVRVPSAVGAKRTVNEQLDPTAMLALATQVPANV